MSATRPRRPRPQNEDQFPGEPVRRRRVPAGYAILTTLATLILALFLNADGLTRTAERQKPGFQRSVTVGLMHPIKAVANGLALTAPANWLARVTGNTETTEFTTTEGVELADQNQSTPIPHTQQSTTTTTTLPTYRTPTPADPLRILVAGDSLSGYLGPAISEGLRGFPVDVIQDQRVGTGLARPDVVDWPAELTAKMDTDTPDVVVLFIGGNDDQDLRVADGWLPLARHDEWKQEYQRRIAQLMDITARPGVSVYWIGLPAMGKRHLDAQVDTINSLIRTEAAARPHQVTYVSSGDALNDRDGRFTAYLPGDNGDVKIRENDGVHPTMAGMKRIVAEFLPQLIATRHLEPEPPPTTTPTPAPATTPATTTTQPATTRPTG